MARDLVRFKEATNKKPGKMAIFPRSTSSLKIYFPLKELLYSLRRPKLRVEKHQRGDSKSKRNKDGEDWNVSEMTILKSVPFFKTYTKDGVIHEPEV